MHLISYRIYTELLLFCFTLRNLPCKTGVTSVLKHQPLYNVIYLVNIYICSCTRHKRTNLTNSSLVSYWEIINLPTRKTFSIISLLEDLLQLVCKYESMIRKKWIENNKHFVLKWLDSVLNIVASDRKWCRIRQSSGITTGGCERWWRPIDLRLIIQWKFTSVNRINKHSAPLNCRFDTCLYWCAPFWTTLLCTFSFVRVAFIWGQLASYLTERVIYIQVGMWASL